MRVLAAVISLLVGCSESGTGSNPDPAASPARVASSTPTATPAPAAQSNARPASRCLVKAFASSVALREASGAVWAPAAHGLPPHVIAVGDSGTRGAFAVVDAASGALLARGSLPLGAGVSDDIEGFTRSGENFYALTSNGYVRSYHRSGPAAFELQGEPYPLHPELACAPRRSNCGLDFEGLCLAATPPNDGCAGFAASRKQGVLVCVLLSEDGRLTADPSRTLRVAPPLVLSGCAIAPEGDLLYAGSNGLAANAVARVTGWRDPAHAQIEALGPAGPGFAEAIAVGPDRVIYRFSDSGGLPSAMGALTCPAAP